MKPEHIVTHFIPKCWRSKEKGDLISCDNLAAGQIVRCLATKEDADSTCAFRYPAAHKNTGAGKLSK